MFWVGAFLCFPGHFPFITRSVAGVIGSCDFYQWFYLFLFFTQTDINEFTILLHVEEKNDSNEPCFFYHLILLLFYDLDIIF